MPLLRPVLALTLGLVCAGVGTTPPAAAAVTRTRASVVTVFGTAGDPVTGGHSQVWRSGPDRMDLRTQGDGVAISAGPARFVLLPRAGDALSYGDYAATSATPTTSSSGMSFTVEGRSCPGDVVGRFTVFDITPALDRLWASFEYGCASGPMSFGEIRMNEDEDPAVLTAPSRVRFPDQTLGSDGRTVPVTVFNTGSQPLTLRAAGIAGDPTKSPLSPVGDDPVGVAGTISFAIADNGCTTIQPGQSCVVNVTYRPVFPGAVQGRLQLTDSTPTGLHETGLAGNADYPGQPQ